MILIDGHALAFRSYYALERSGMRTSDMQPTWAIYGFFKAIFDLIKNKKFKFDCIAVAFDVSHQTFRVEKFEQYKANRESMPDSLSSQMGYIMEGLRAFNIPIYTKEGYEADDVIGTICKKASTDGNKTIILTGDRDAFQLVDDEGLVRVLIPSKGELVEYDKQKVYEKMGVYPNQIADLKGLSGDKSDNIPGVQGIGDKTASTLLNKYNSIENIYANIEEIPQKALKEKLINGKEMAYLSKDLATIRRDVELDFNIECANMELPDFAAVQEFFKKLQFYAFLRNFEQIAGYFTVSKDCIVNASELKPTNNENDDIVKFKESGVDLSSIISDKGAPMQLGLFGSSEPKINSKFEKITVDTEDKFKKLVEELKEQTLFAVDAEITSQNPMQGDIVGIAIAFNPQIKSKNNRVFTDKTVNSRVKTFYIPIFHQIGEQLEIDYVLENLKPILENSEIKKTFHNLKFNVNIFRRNGINLKGILFDTMLASYVKNPSRKHDIKIQTLDYLDYPLAAINDETGKDEINTLESFSVEEAANYVCDFVFAILELTKYWEETFSDDEKKLVYEIEVPLAIVLADMEWCGVSINKDYLKNLSEELKENLGKIEKEIYELAGEGFNISSPKQVGQILFDKLGIKPPRKGKTKTGYSTSIQVLEQLAPNYPIVGKIIEHRHLSKLIGTYLDALPELIDPYDDRIHTSFNQATTVTGRLSSSNPNLQNIPARTELGSKIREAFVPKNNDYVILSADYSQIELRLLAHCSGDENLIKAFIDGVDVHTRTAANVFGVNEKDVTKDMRYKAKAVNFGIIYGQTRWGLASALKISNEEASQFIDIYFKTYPKVKKYMEQTIAYAYENGYVKTLYGRRRYLAEELHSSTRQIKEFAERAAINAPLQGTAADLIKLAMIELHKKLEENHLKSKIILQVHDELVLEVHKDELEFVKKLVVETMELGQPFKVPLKLDISVSDSWKEQ